MTTHKFTRRNATPDELRAHGWIVDGEHVQSPTTRAWYMIDEFFVANSITGTDGEQVFGDHIYLDSSMPIAERWCVRLDVSEV